MNVFLTVPHPLRTGMVLVVQERKTSRGDGLVERRISRARADRRGADSCRGREDEHRTARPAFLPTSTGLFPSPNYTTIRENENHVYIAKE